ncbi:hypothetical protein ENKNEFLB_03884 [Nocardioides aquaticus]|uniref:Uncharacterized protein n=1 Tax=Nocardioides aquaticus TaxID=160826 RepID=A0ABX8ELS9_9ACTN|nr:hypothetical protein [Nocardioides aquaticus]QVT81474.1 hypothetical protein ENKNEFLB_03884 [Nocardioides aquaticus]
MDVIDLQPVVIEPFELRSPADLMAEVARLVDLTVGCAYAVLVLDPSGRQQVAEAAVLPIDSRLDRASEAERRQLKTYVEVLTDRWQHERTGTWPSPMRAKLVTVVVREGLCVWTPTEWAWAKFWRYGIRPVSAGEVVVVTEHGWCDLMTKHADHRPAAAPPVGHADPMPTDDLTSLTTQIRAEIGEDPGAWPGGYPQEIEACLIDAVLSIRARYGATADTGVRKRVRDYRTAEARGAVDDLSVLADKSEAALLAVTGHQKLSGGATKAAAIIAAARALKDVGVVKADDLTDRHDEAKRAYCSVKGLGWVTFEYFTMLAGHPGVKADTWVVRYVDRAVGRPVDTKTARTLVHEAAAELDHDASALDHAIWKYERTPR